MLQLSFSDKIELGCDEAGRGCLAGPVVAAAVILPSNFKNKLLNDSKQLSKKTGIKKVFVIEECLKSYIKKVNKDDKKS